MVIANVKTQDDYLNVQLPDYFLKSHLAKQSEGMDAVANTGKYADRLKPPIIGT